MGHDGRTITTNTTSSDDDDGGFSLPAVLQSFASSPRRFILGAVLTTLLEGITGIVSAFLEGVLLILAGSQPAVFNGATEQSLGLADLPVLVADLLINGSRPAGDAILTGIETVNASLFQLANFAGPLSPVIITGVVVGEIILVILLLERVVLVLVDVIPGGGGLTK